MNTRIVAAAIAAGLVATAVHAQSDAGSTGQSAQGDVSVTIYATGLSLVQDVRQLDISAGRSRVALPDVSAEIRPETLAFNAPGTEIVEQNFDYDLLSPGALMDKSIGQMVTLIRTNPATGAETRERAEVLSTEGGVVVRIGNRIEVLRDDGLPVRVIFDRVPPNLRARPTLSVTLDSTRAGRRPVSIRYLTPDLGWNADYVALYNEQEGTIDMQGWVTLTNTTGTTFHQAKTLLVAGNPNKGAVSSSNRFNAQAMAGDADKLKTGTQTASRERLGDFYLYPIPGRTTIANNQTKQVSFLDAKGVPATRKYAAVSSWLESDREPRNVSAEIAFSTSRDGGLGDALPSGTVRFYQRDARGDAQFIGENQIGHTPMGSELSLRTGDAFDIFMQSAVESRSKITAADYERSARYRVIAADGTTSQIESDRAVDFYRTTMRYTFTNAKPQPVVVDLTQGGLDRGWWALDYRVVSEDVTGTQINADERLYHVTVPANGRRVVRVTFETRY